MSDEEAGGNLGTGFLVERHADYFKGIRYAISEFGGFSFYLKGKKFFPIEVIQKQVCSIKATIRSRSGHGAFVMKDGAMAKLARMLNQLDKKYLPVHITPVVRTFVEQMAAALPFPGRMVMRQLVNPLFADRALKLLGEKGINFIPMLRNTVNATIYGVEIKSMCCPVKLRLCWISPWPSAARLRSGRHPRRNKRNHR